MKTFGNPATQELVSLAETQPYGFDAPGYHVEQLCTPGRYHANDDRAPWNAYHNPDPAYWRAEYPAAWGHVADDDPGAPWNQPEPNRDPSAYLDENGEPLYWPTPTLVPLVKIAKPENIEGKVFQPVLVWFDDRVERQWQMRDESPDETAKRARKIWPDSAAFLAEFSMEQIAAISLSTDPTIAALRLFMAAWKGEVWSDDPRVVAGISATVAVGIITPELAVSAFGQTAP